TTNAVTSVEVTIAAPAAAASSRRSATSRPATNLTTGRLLPTLRNRSRHEARHLLSPVARKTVSVSYRRYPALLQIGRGTGRDDARTSTRRLPSGGRGSTAAAAAASSW